jgi:hypothetical protein
LIASPQREVPPEEVPERQQSTYKAALELELWKEMEQEKFLKGTRHTLLICFSMR